MDLRRWITVAEETTEKAERLFRDLQVDSSRQMHSLPVLSFLQAMYNQHEMANVIVPNDPRILFENLLSL